MRANIAKLTATLIAPVSIGLAACGGGGGGGDSPPPPPPPPQVSGAEGFWNGTTSSGFDLFGVVLENGEYWFVYYDEPTEVLYGLVQGNATWSSGNFTSTDGRDIDLDDGTVTPMALTGSYRERESLQGVATPQGGGTPVTFTTLYDASYETPATAAAVSGVWRGSFGTDRYTITVAASGTFTGAAASGCTFGGSIVPRPSGRAVYNLVVTFNGGVCLFGTQTFRGIAVTEGSGASQILVTAAVNATRSSALVQILDR